MEARPGAEANGCATRDAVAGARDGPEANGCAAQGRLRDLPGADPDARARLGLAAAPASAPPAAPPGAASGVAPPPLAVPPFLHALLAGLGEADAFELDARLRRAVALEQRLEAELAPLVRAVAGAGLQRLRGFATLEAWARERLGVSPRKVRALLRLARAAERWPALGEAFASGRLSWVQAHAILPALALGSTEADGGGPALWIERAASLPVTRLRDEVDAALLGAAPAVAGPEAERQTGAQPRGAAEGVAAADEPEAHARPAEPAERETERFFFVGPAPVARLFRAVLCSVRLHLERTRGRLPSEGEAAGWMFAHAVATWQATAARDARTRRAQRVFERDGWRCTVPGCTSYRNLHDHHIRFRSAGGSDALSNRTTLCAFHHLRGVHAGRVSVTGAAPARLRFELGLRPGRPALVVYAPQTGSKKRISRTSTGPHLACG